MIPDEEKSLAVKEAYRRIRECGFVDRDVRLYEMCGRNWRSDGRSSEENFWKLTVWKGCKGTRTMSAVGTLDQVVNQVEALFGGKNEGTEKK